MTPTELRKQLVKSLSTAQVESVDNNGEAVIEHEADRLLQLFTADRKRVELEARLDELAKIEIGGDNIWTVDSGTDTAMLIEERIAELKAQQEEV